jgi:DNA-binding XRE family transcriptional regulator
MERSSNIIRKNIYKKGGLYMLKDTRFLKLKYWRQKLGLSQGDMSQLLGYKSVSNYSMKENGKGKFYLSEAIKILNTFNKLMVKLEKPPLSLEDIFLD